MASFADNLFAHAMDLAPAVPGTAVIAGALVGVAVFATSFLLYQLASCLQSEPAPRVVYVMPYSVPTLAPFRPPMPGDRESAIETGPMSVVTIERPSPRPGARLTLDASNERRNVEGAPCAPDAARMLRSSTGA
jgi:hypothetical protein